MARPVFCWQPATSRRGAPVLSRTPGSAIFCMSSVGALALGSESSSIAAGMEHVSWRCTRLRWPLTQVILARRLANTSSEAVFTMRGLLKRKRHAVAILSLSAITMVKILAFLALFEMGQIHPYVGGSAINYFLPASNSLLTTGAFYVAPDMSRSSKVAPGYPAFLALVQSLAPRSHLAFVVCLQMAFDCG